jgi:5-formyltetrahydrofolate cyclo-ligase
MTKKELREVYLKKRLALSAQELAVLNRNLCATFFKEVDLSRIRVLHTFLPLVRKNEPDTCLIIDELKKRYPDLRISIPKIIGDKMVSYYFSDTDQLAPGAFGISEPQTGSRTDSREIDMVLVPLLAYDKQGHRVGYGKGHYDQFLKTCRPDCRKIGLSFFGPEEKIEDIFEGDEKLNRVVSTEGDYSFQ